MLLANYDSSGSFHLVSESLEMLLLFKATDSTIHSLDMIDAMIQGGETSQV